MDLILIEYDYQAGFNQINNSIYGSISSNYDESI